MARSALLGWRDGSWLGIGGVHPGDIMALQAGIVGLPNVGKSTLFNALTAAGALAANYPFATIEPNTGMVTVPDPRLDEIVSVISTRKLIPATVEILDIAGLVRGASKGEGLGNQFLGHIRNVDAILQVVRCFEDGDITHVDGTIDPLRDIETIQLELILSDLTTCEKRVDRYKKVAKSGDKEAKLHFDVAVKHQACPGADQQARPLHLQRQRRRHWRQRVRGRRQGARSQRERWRCGDLRADRGRDLRA
jgi:GTP-binding protein YchF